MGGLRGRDAYFSKTSIPTGLVPAGWPGEAATARDGQVAAGFFRSGLSRAVRFDGLFCALASWARSFGVVALAAGAFCAWAAAGGRSSVRGVATCAATGSATAANSAATM